MELNITYDKALEILKEYNKEPFHIQHGETVGSVMAYFASQLGYDDEKDFWRVAGLLHDVDFEMWPEEHCVKAKELLDTHHVSQDIIHAVQSHGYNLCCDVEPTLEMEKVLYATDELTGIIGAYALMRPSKNCDGLELKSLKKKFKDKKFAAGCNRAVIKAGAEMLNWDLDKLLTMTITAMQNYEKEVREGLI